MSTATRRAWQEGGVMSRSESVIDPASVTDDWKELASRADDGLQISLVWSKSADRVQVTVCDERLREPFDIPINGADALSAFHHPFAYAAVTRRAGAREGERASLFLRQQV
jgi:hypothetical protein